MCLQSFRKGPKLTHDGSSVALTAARARCAQNLEGTMRVDSSAEPEEMIASLRSKRMLMLLLALGGIAVALGVLLSAAGAMYAKDPVRELQTEKAALEAATQP
jgi:hypothetical protein